MYPVSEDVKDLLVTGSYGTFASSSATVWGIYIGTEPANQRKTITLYDTLHQKEV